LVAVGIDTCEWAVIRLLFFLDIGAVTERREAAFQPVLTRYKLL
jgi:hypothetical protein